jgi:hypothetical protein
MRISGRHIVLVTLTTLALAACGDESADGVESGTNMPPIIAGTPVTTLSAGSAYAFTPTAADPDGDAITFRATNVPGWANFDAATGALRGTPSEANVGMTDMIHIEVTDSQAVTLLTPFRIQVTSNASTPPPTNVAPTIAGTPATTATVGQAYTFVPTGDDANDDALTFSIQNAPSWITFTPATGRLSGTPTTASIGTTSNIVITVSDGQASASLAAFNLQVAAAPTTPPVNRAPTITGTPGTTVAADTAYSFRPVASDPDGNTLLFSIQNQPSWATFSTSTGRLAGTPTSANVGTSARITITVSDGTLSTSLASFQIQVTAPSNRAPTISGSPATSSNVDTAYTFQPSASDPDGNLLTFRIDNRPAWLTFNTATGQLSGTPTAADVGTFSNILISVTDGTASASLTAFSIAVVQSSNGTAVVHWTAPMTNADGSALTPSLSGYRVVYGRSSSSLDQTSNVENPGLTTYTVTNLSSGQWYFAVYAVNSAGGVSEISNLATKIIP